MANFMMNQNLISQSSKPIIRRMMPSDQNYIRSSRLVTGESPIQVTRSKSILSSQPVCGNQKCSELIQAYEEAFSEMNQQIEKVLVEKGEFEILYEHTLQ